MTYTGSDKKHDNYVRWIVGGDEDVEVVKLSAGQSNLHDMVELDGLVLSGGVDIDPELYDGELGYEKAPTEGFQTERDLFEQAVLEMAWEQGTPVLGVCRGLQLINVSRQGTLVQDLGQQGDEVHENVTGVDKQHPVKIMGGSLLAAIAGQEEGVVNSAHHQAIERLGEELAVNSRAADGTIEGLEWADPAGKPFMIAVQWHPERMYTNGLPDVNLYKKLRDRFVEEVRKSMEKKK